MSRVLVVCPDGVVRRNTFADRQAAEEWAEWGHCCTSGHTFVVVELGDVDAAVAS